MESINFPPMTVTALNVEDEDNNHKGEEMNMLEESLRSSIRQADVYKRVSRTLLLHVPDPVVQMEVVDINKMREAWRSKDKRTSIELTAHEAELLLREIGDGDIREATRERVAAYLHHLRYEKYLTFKDWTKTKTGSDSSTESLKIKEFQKALAGEVYTLDTEEVKGLLKMFDIIPEEALDAEALVLAQQWLKGTEGQTAIRRATRTIQGVAPGEMLIVDQTSFTKARKQALVDRIPEERKHIKSNISHSYRRFEEFRHDIVVSGCVQSFGEWLKKKQEGRKIERKAIRKWNKIKKIDERVSSIYSHSYSLLSSIEERVASLVSITFKEHKITAVFNQRYRSRQGINLEASLKRLKAAVMEKSPCPQVVSCAIVREVLGDMLYSMYADPSTVKQVRKVYDPLGEAKRQLNAYVKENLSSLEKIVDEKVKISSDGGQEVSREKVWAQLKASMKADLENKILTEVYPIHGDEEAVKVGKEEALKLKKEAKVEHKKWLLSKTKSKEDILKEREEQKALKAAQKAAAKKERLEKKKKMKKYMKSLKKRPLTATRVSHPQPWVGVGLEENEDVKDISHTSHIE